MSLGLHPAIQSMTRGDDEDDVVLDPLSFFLCESDFNDALSEKNVTHRELESKMDKEIMCIQMPSIYFMIQKWICLQLQKLLDKVPNCL